MSLNKWKQKIVDITKYSKLWPNSALQSLHWYFVNEPCIYSSMLYWCYFLYLQRCIFINKHMYIIIKNIVQKEFTNITMPSQLMDKNTLVLIRFCTVLDIRILLVYLNIKELSKIIVFTVPEIYYILIKVLKLVRVHFLITYVCKMNHMQHTVHQNQNSHFWARYTRIPLI